MGYVCLAIGVIALVCGIILIFDARPLFKMYFSFGKENEIVSAMKILGFIFTIIGAILVTNFLPIIFR